MIQGGRHRQHGPDRQARLSCRDVLRCIVNWLVWGTMAALVLSQFLGIVRSTIEFTQPMLFGTSPENPSSFIPGTNDEPYTDRSIVCMAQGRSFAPMQLSRVLSDQKLAPVADTSNESLNGYRVVKREVTTLDPAIEAHFTHVCERIDYSLDAIQKICTKLGYNVTEDTLRIVGDIFSNTTQEIPRALPILIMPFWDNATYVHYAIPGWDGMACTFRLDGRFINLEETSGVMRAVPRSIRALKTVEWLGKPDGVWRNGWYEDGSGQRWSSDMMTTAATNKYGIQSRTFDTFTSEEIDCQSPPTPPQCRDSPIISHWGAQSTIRDVLLITAQVYISNGTHFGKFLVDGSSQRTIENKYSLETFISNISIFVLLFRWFVSMAAMLRSYHLGVTPWQTASIGCLSCSRTFSVLPIMLLPRLKITLAAFWTAGCELEGEQRALSDAWFVVYPAIFELTLYLFSLLNLIAKASRRRMSDSLFGPTVAVFVILHRVRLSLAKSGWLGFDSRIPSLVSSTEFASWNVIDLLTPSIALRMTGGVHGIFYTKLLVLAVNFLPLLWSEQMSPSGNKSRSYAMCHVVKALALRACHVGGLGLSPVYELSSSIERREKPNSSSHALVTPINGRKTLFHARVQRGVTIGPTHHDSIEAAVGPVMSSQRHVLTAYEIDRLGYLIYGGKYLITYEDWFILTSLAPLREVEKLWNHRILVFDVTIGDDAYHITPTPQLYRVDSDHFKSIAFYEVTLTAFW